MKIYDMHIHVDTGTPDSAKLLNDLENAGIYGGGIISAAPLESKENLLSLDYKDRVKNVLEWCKNSGDRLIPVLWVNPFEKDIKDKIHDAKESGIRSDGPVHRRAAAAYVSRCADPHGTWRLLDKYNPAPYRRKPRAAAWVHPPPFQSSPGKWTGLPQR